MFLFAGPKAKGKNKVDFKLKFLKEKKKKKKISVYPFEAGGMFNNSYCDKILWMYFTNKLIFL
jgi:hypothetical protein